MIRKKIETSYGVDAEIWDMIDTHWNKKSKTCDITLYGYVSLEKMEFDPIATRNFTYKESDGIHFDRQPYSSELYDKICESKLDEFGKETNEFFGGVEI